MKFTFYEEYPTDENLEKLAELRVPIELIVASSSYRLFRDIQSQIKNSTSTVQRIGYWPILSHTEGYWMSPFADKSALERTIGEIKENDMEGLLLHWDAELPVTKPQRIVKAENFTLNKKNIREFLRNHKQYVANLVVSEWPTILLPEKAQQTLGVAFDPEEIDAEKVKMVYTSWSSIVPHPIRDLSRRASKEILIYEAKKNRSEHGKRAGIALGCLHTGEFGKEPRITPNDLREDLETVRNLGYEKVYLYRLGGLNSEYAQIMDEFN